ncbi:MAG: hypothetical protein HYU63_05145, partial [Armatimonadetes bacterium]|nr:hypothetical protein [Armatimonadota bacterium]
MISLKILAAVIYKDLLDALKNKTIFFAVLTPILLSLIFSLVFSNKDLRLPKVICFSEDPGFYKFIKNSKIFDLEQALKKEKAKNLVSLGKFNAAIILEGKLNKI